MIKWGTFSTIVVFYALKELWFHISTNAIYNAACDWRFLMQLHTSIHTHRWSRSIIYGPGFPTIHNNLLQFLNVLFCELLPISYKLRCFSIQIIVINYFHQFWEMVGIPFSIIKKFCSSSAFNNNTWVICKTYKYR